jgi:SOS-response transcriptional repressor LexA
MSRRPTITQAELAEMLGLTRFKVANYESGRTELPKQVAKKVAQYWKLPEDWFWDGQDLPPDSPIYQSKDVGAPQHPVAAMYAPMPMGGPVPAGSWADPDDTEEMIEVPGFLVERGRFAATAEGDSMLPLIEQGDLLIFQKESRPRTGTIVLARNGQNQVTVKVLRVKDNRYVLDSLNTAYPVAEADYSEHLGFLVAIWKREGVSKGMLYYDDAGIRP